MSRCKKQGAPPLMEAWNFTKLIRDGSPEEIFWCMIYEYAVEAADRFRVYLEFRRGIDREMEIVANGGTPDAKPDNRSALPNTFCEGYHPAAYQCAGIPGAFQTSSRSNQWNHWLELDHNDRKKFLIGKLPKQTDSKMHPRVFTDPYPAVWDTRNVIGKLPLEEAVRPGVVENGVQYIVLRIDWKRSKQNRLDDFGRWMDREKRRGDSLVNNIGTSGLPTLKVATERLQFLAARRLINAVGREAALRLFTSKYRRKTAGQGSKPQTKFQALNALTQCACRADRVLDELFPHAST